MQIDTSYFNRCIDALERALQAFEQAPPESVEQELFRSATIKEFELVLEQAGKLLRKALRPWMPSKRAVDRLTFKEVFRQAGLHGLLTLEEVERWLCYRDNRNELAHDYGVKLVEETLPLLPDFIRDARRLAKVIEDAAEKEG